MMEKMRMESPDVTQENIEKLAALFPQVVTETCDEHGKLKKAVNFALLRQLLSSEELDGDEAYEFTWVGKKASLVEAGRPIRKTLRPCVEESKHWETTENLYIEGDNLDVLKLLQESYLGKIKMIYIDPPYNTGNDFIYKDNFSQSREAYEEDAGVYDEDGDRLFRNTESNGRFHSDWCSMIYPRLVLARNLLSDDGVIFISIDDNEQENVKKICDEVFGYQNFVAQLIWERAFSPKNDAKYISNSHDYILMYARKIEKFIIGRLPRTKEANERYSNPDNDPRGPWMSSDISVKTYNADCDYPITAPSGRVIEPPTGRCWSLSKKAFLERLQDNRIWFGPDGKSVPRIKRFLSDLKYDGMAPTSIMLFKDVGHSQEGAQEVAKLLNGSFFSGPKPVRLMKRLLLLAHLDNDSIVLDFFSGSSSMAHAVMQLNAEDGGNRKFIMVQLPEVCAPESEAAKAGYKTICEIGKERIRRAGEKIAQEHAAAAGKDTQYSLMEKGRQDKKTLDTGFRVFKLDSTNMKDVYYSAGDYRQEGLTNLISNIKEDRSDLDLLYACLLEWGLPLSMPHTSREIGGVPVHFYNDTDLVACFAKNVGEETIRGIARYQPLRVVFRESSFADAPTKCNVEELFKVLAPHTTVKVL